MIADISLTRCNAFIISESYVSYFVLERLIVYNGNCLLRVYLLWYHKRELLQSLVAFPGRCSVRQISTTKTAGIEKYSSFQSLESFKALGSLSSWYKYYTNLCEPGLKHKDVYSELLTSLTTPEFNRCCSQSPWCCSVMCNEDCAWDRKLKSLIVVAFQSILLRA